jgi:UDP-N-acetylmuramate dehydrogenase
MGKNFRNVEVEGNNVMAGAIAPMSKVARAAEEAALEGLEFGFDIPGTVGGALRMNAGAHGGEVRNVLAEARGFDHEGTFWTVPVSDIRFAYRVAVYPTELIFTEGVFKLTPGDREVLAERRKKNHEYRLRTQPKGNTVGSVFKNPEGDHAGRLVEAAGFKGFRFGGAVVSEKHANWILNDRQGTAHDIECLIRTIQEKVHEQFGVELEPEVRIVGEALPAGEEVS